MGERVNSEELRTRVLPAVLGGTRRDSASLLTMFGEDRDVSILNALSLGGQFLRFSRPPLPKEFLIEHWPHDERAIVPEGMRSKIARLLDKCTEDTARALALALDEQKLRLHPFDFPRLDGFVRKYADLLGATARYWTQRETSVRQSRGYFFDTEELSSDNWTEAPLRKRAKFLRDLRKREPQTARELLEKCWPSEDPDIRVQLISILQTGLTNADQPFLEGIQKDRAPRVRTIVQRMLGVLSVEGVENPALAACMERIKKSKAGVLRKRVALNLELPATVKGHEVDRWIHELFSDVTFVEFERACETGESELVEAAEKDTNLLFALALMATREGRFALLGSICDEIPDAWGRMAALAIDGLLADDEQRADWAIAAIKPKKWLPEIPFPAWSWLHQQLEGPMPAGIMREVLASEMWAEQLSDEKKGPSLEIIQVICALCPTALRASLHKQLEPLSVERTDKGITLLEILSELESVR